MPLYEYRCFDCGTQFEKLVGYAAADDGVTCPTCGQVRAKRLLSLVAPVARRSAGAATSDWSSGGGGCGCTSCSCGHAH